MKKINIIIISMFLFSMIIGWEVLSRSDTTLQFILPSPSSVFQILWSHSGRFLYHSTATLKVILGGIFLATVVSFPLAWLMAFFGPLRLVLQPMFIAIQCIPMFTLAPLMVLWFGWSYTAMVIPTALMIFFPLTMNIYQGLCSAPQSLLEYFATHQATPWQLFCKLQLPWALPHIFSGFRIAISLAGIGAVAGEWAGAQQGLGLLMLESRRAADIEMMFGALVCVVLLSLGLYLCWLAVQRLMRKRFCRPQLLVLFFLLLAGCQQEPKLNTEVRLVLDWFPNPNHIPLFVGVGQGFFKQQEIDLKILKLVDPSDGVPYLMSQQADLCLTYMPHTIQAMSKGASVIPIGVLINQPLNGVLFRSDEGIESPKDLGGKIIGYCVDGYHTKFLQSMLDNRSIAAKQLLNVSFDLVTTLANKQVDAIYGAYWNIEGEHLRFFGIGVDYFPLSDFGVPNYSELIFLARRESPQSDDRFVRRFQRALQQSIDYAVENPQAAYESYISQHPDKSGKTREWEYQAWKATIPVFAHHQQVDVGQWNRFVQWLVDHQLLSSVEGALLPNDDHF